MMIKTEAPGLNKLDVSLGPGQIEIFHICHHTVTEPPDGYQKCFQTQWKHSSPLHTLIGTLNNKILDDGVQ